MQALMKSIGACRPKAGLLPKGRFVRGVSTIAGGTVVAQIAVVAVSPLLTRLYDPAQFGALGVFTSLLGILLVVTTLRLELAIPIAEGPKQAASLLCLSLGATALTGLLVLCALLLGLARTNLPFLTPLGGWIYLLPVGMLLGGGYQSLTYGATRAKAYNALARTKLAQGVGMAGTQVTLGFLPVGAFGLLAGYVVGQAAGVVTLSREIVRSGSFSFRGLNLATLWDCLGRYRKFPLVSTWSALLNAASVWCPVLFLASFHGAVAAGAFALTQRVITIPISMVGRAVNQVFTGEAGECLRNAEERPKLRRLYWRTLGYLALLGAGPVLIIGLVSPTVFSVVFGEEWRRAGEFARILALGYAAQFAVGPLTTLLLLIGRNERQLAWDFTRSVVIVGGFACLTVAQASAESMLLFFSLSLVFFYLVHVVLSDLALRQAGATPINDVR